MKSESIFTDKKKWLRNPGETSSWSASKTSRPCEYNINNSVQAGVYPVNRRPQRPAEHMCINAVLSISSLHLHQSLLR